jgi:hypothetical protein
VTAGSQPYRLPPLVELAGPAGVGKSTLASALRRRHPATQGTIWGLPALRLLENGIQLLPTLFFFWLQSRSLLWDESRHMVRLKTLHRALQRGELPREPIMIFDEGPIFALAWLRGFGHESMRSEAADEWWRLTLRDWAQVMDAVVVLEAPDTLLAERIRARPMFHEVKQASDPEISGWMARFRAALGWVLAQMAAQGGPVVVRMTTDHDTPDDVAEQVLLALSQAPHGN